MRAPTEAGGKNTLGEEVGAGHTWLMTTPPSFLVLVRLQVTGEGVRKALTRV